jgi:hypothetical protein
MNWKQAVNTALARTGHRLQKVEDASNSASRRRRVRTRPGDRLLEAPTFILCSVRSGSTLLRVLLDSHSQIHCPHEMHLRDMKVSVRDGYPEKALREVGLDAKHLEYLLWDRVLHRELEETGKQLLVNKTPNDVFIVDRILECWPDARFIFLLRHPAAIARSRHKARPQDSDKRNAEMVRRYLQATEDARNEHGERGITVRYEDLASEPARETRRICEFLGLPWEETMLQYGEFNHGAFRPGLGDWSENIKSGQVQPPAPPPSAEETPPALRELATTWGYLDAAEAVASAEKGETAWDSR